VKRTGAMLLVVLMGSFVADAQERPHRYVSYLPAKHPLITHGATPFIEHMAVGRNPVHYKLFPGGALLGAENVLAGLQHNLAEIGQVVFIYYPAQFPYINIMAELAMVGSYAPAVSAASTEFLWGACTPCKEEARRQGIVLLGLSSTSPYLHLSTEPINRWEDFRNLRVRSPGAVWDRWIEYTGGVPIFMSSGEAYEALTRGQVDVVLNPYSVLRTSSLWDAAKHVPTLPVGTYRPIGATVMSAAHWASLDDAQKLQAAWASTQASIGVSFGYMESDDLASARLEQEGVSLHEPDNEMRSRLSAFLDQEREWVIGSLRDRWQMHNIEVLVDAYIALNAKWHARFVMLEGDQERMAQILWEEVVAPRIALEYGLSAD